MMWDEPGSEPKEETCCVLLSFTKTSTYPWEATDQSKQEVGNFKVIWNFFIPKLPFTY
jgi:hypothetical protein